MGAVLAGIALHRHSQRDCTFSLSRPQLQAALDERVPVSRRYLRLFEVTLDAPAVHLAEGSDRIGVALDVSLAAGTGERSARYTGRVETTSGLRYDPDSGRLFLTDPRVERVDLPGLSREHGAGVERALTLAVGEYFERFAVYTLQPSDLRRAAARRLLREVTIADGRLCVTLGV